MDKQMLEQMSLAQVASRPVSANKLAQDNLKALKNSLNLSDEAMATAVGVPLSRMVVMLYGEPSRIPGKIAEKIKVLEAISEARKNEPTSGSGRPRRVRGQVEQVLREDQKELLDLQKSMGLTHDDLARIAGIPRSRMMTYVYGRTRRIPVAVLEAIRNVRDGRQIDETPYLFDAVQEMQHSLPEFIARWQQRLGIAADDMVETAQALGVSKSTLTRWLDGTSGTRPSFVRKCLESLHAYEQARKTV